MSVVVLDGATIRDFVEDDPAFHCVIEEHFASLDTDGDGRLTHADMETELKSLRLLETHFGVDDETSADEVVRIYDGIFDLFDHDHNGTIDLEEFKDEMRKVVMAVAKGLGFTPVQMVLEEDSFLKKAAERATERVDVVPKEAPAEVKEEFAKLNVTEEEVEPAIDDVNGEEEESAATNDVPEEEEEQHVTDDVPDPEDSET